MQRFRWVAAAGLVAWSGVAHADPYMWGIGVSLGSNVFPSAYPLVWPERINKYDVNDDGETDVGPKGNEQSTDLEKVRSDVDFGGEGYYYLDRSKRIGGILGIDTGTGFFDGHFLAKYDQVVYKNQDFDVLLGGGLGYGSQTFKGLDNSGALDTDPNAERLTISYFPARAELSGMVKLKTWAFEPTIYGGVNLPSSHRWLVDGKEADGTVSGTPFNYLTIGVQITAFYGDFTPPKKKKKGNNNNGGNGNNNGKGKGGKK